MIRQVRTGHDARPASSAKPALQRLERHLWHSLCGNQIVIGARARFGVAEPMIRQISLPGRDRRREMRSKGGNRSVRRRAEDMKAAGSR
jgi:hypothetical protein